MIVFPIAKINIGLRITGKRPDGFHNIETIFYPVRLNDALEFVIHEQPAGKDELAVTGIDTGGKPEDNLVMKAVLRLREKHSFPFLNIHLHKAIPVGAGLGGGSSDAACILKSVNKHFELKIDNSEIKEISLEIGSDCPFFIDGSPSHASGRGEIFEPVRDFLSGTYLVILNPGVGINTGEAYKNSHSGIPEKDLRSLTGRPINEWRGKIVNDFEDYAFAKHPIIGRLKEELYNCKALFSLMSGSGSSVFGIFSEKPLLPSSISNYVIWQGKM
jgi:4-diphosphocytidyl-2-C-methyl-D-erythritol kinase